MKLKWTDWFGVHQKPVRKGVYPTRFRCDFKSWRGWSRWMGAAWSQQMSTPEEARDAPGYGGAQAKEWRGVLR